MTDARVAGAVSAASLTADLAAEHAALAAVVSDCSGMDLETPTPSPGWTVADQLGHLGYFDRTAKLAIVDADAFNAHLAGMMVKATEGPNPMSMDAITLEEPRSLGPAVVDWWLDGTTALIESAHHIDESARLPWYGPPMSAKSFLTARLMETWAHGQDVVDALGAEREPTDRLRHIAQLGFITRGWSYKNRGLDAPDVPVRVELSGPGGGTWGDGDESIVGPALDFCLVVTQRRNLADTGLVVTGAAAADWMAIAQAFAGGATDGPAPR